MTKLFSSSWLDIGHVLIYELWPRHFSFHKYAKTKLGQYPDILTSGLVTKPYIFKLADRYAGQGDRGRKEHFVAVIQRFGVNSIDKNE